MPTHPVCSNQRADNWYTKARFGLFYHWGLFTGGGNLQSHEQCEPLGFSTVEGFEEAAGCQERVARNMVGIAKWLGAKYLTFTVLHTCDAYTVMYPTKLKGFNMRTARDYVGAIAEECSREGIRLVLYLPVDHKHWDVGGEWLAPECRDPQGYSALLRALIDELAGKLGHHLSGIWLDGGHGSTFPEYIHTVLPDCVVIMNNDTAKGTAGTDVSATEFLATAPSPVYNRPDGLRSAHPYWGIPPAAADYNEDIPSCNGWWWQGTQGTDNPYVADPTYLVREMVSSLGQRGKWNYALGLGPLVDGSIPPEFVPMANNIKGFLSWAGVSLYGTVGGGYGSLVPGWWNDGAFGSVTVPDSDGSVHYVHVTTAPSTGELRIPKRKELIAIKVVDLESGDEMPFRQTKDALTVLTGDWEVVSAIGDRVFRVQSSYGSSDGGC